MTLTASAPPRAALRVPPRPSKLIPTLTALVVGAIVMLSTTGLDVTWADLLAIPGEVWHYGTLMFVDPNWERLPRALVETWRSISMAWLGAILCVVFSIPLGMLAARGVGPALGRLPDLPPGSGLGRDAREVLGVTGGVGKRPDRGASCGHRGGCSSGVPTIRSTAGRGFSH